MNILNENSNFKKYIEANNLLTEQQKNIWIIICKRYSGMGNNISRNSHIKKNKTLNLYDIFNQLQKQYWKCYYSKLNFDINIPYMCPSIDRIDSTDTNAYSKDNCVIVLEFCQLLKNAYDLSEFKRCVSSIATGILDENETTTNSLIGGGKKKGIKDWKQIDLNRPLKMSKIQYYIYEILKNKDEYLSRNEITNKIKEIFKDDSSKGGLHSALTKMEKNKYILIDNSEIEWKYKLERTSAISKLNKNTTICCGGCKRQINILEFRARDARGKNKEIDLNLYYTICTDCNTTSTNKYKNKDLPTFILRQISGRPDKKGNVTKENFKQLKGSDGKCAITGIPLIAKNDSGMFNQASPDRIDNTKNYDIQIICLALNFARNNYDNLSNDTILSIIKNIENYYKPHFKYRMV